MKKFKILFWVFFILIIPIIFGTNFDYVFFNGLTFGCVILAVNFIIKQIKI
jgi:hypothetical protein